jgi:bifunctional ADP-heptose synthase (sugar kinase/adenylyltransferase)/energy-coupling factor transporter ATP-binding protein EcfA2
MSDKTTNVFVVGDLVIDHTIFVRDASGRHRQIQDEPVFEVIRRIDMAGGAANCARILAVLSQGKTFLWGLVGRSHWGSFLSILEKCHAIDEADSNVEFRGVQDETQAQMNTITRLIMVERRDALPNYSDPVHKARFDDYGRLHVAEDKRQAVLYYLKRAREKDGSVGGIIIHDLGMNCLTREMIKEIAKFANEQTPPIPLFVDPKHDRKMYSDIVGTVILPNLSEWCSLVEQQGTHEKWLRKLDNPDSLAEMAQLSFRYLGNFRYHIITCGQQGAVLIFPHPDQEATYKYAVYHVKPHPTSRPNRPPQLGCGDVLTAVFALEFARSNQTPHEILEAFQKANAVVACYRDMSWHRMPGADHVRKMLDNLPPLPEPLAEPSKGMLFLPKRQDVSLSQHETIVPGLISVNATFRRRMGELLADIQNNWEPKPKSVILGAPSGCGKSTIMSALEGSLGNLYGIDVINFKSIQPVDWANLDSYLLKVAEKHGARTGKLLIVVDEAMKGEVGESLQTQGVLLLNAAQEHNIRFLFIGTEFRRDDHPTIGSEFATRCRGHYLPGLAERPIDIPYIVASRLFDGNPKEVKSLRIAGRFLLAITNAILSTNVNPRKLCEWVDDAFRSAFDSLSRNGELTIRYKHLPEAARGPDAQTTDLAADYFTFHRE